MQETFKRLREDPHFARDFTERVAAIEREREAERSTSERRSDLIARNATRVPQTPLPPSDPFGRGPAPGANTTRLQPYS